MQFVSQPGWLCPGWGLRVLVSACWVSFHPHLPPECWIPCETLAFPDNPQMTTSVVGEKCSSDNSQPHGAKGFYESFYEHCQDSLSGGEHVPQSHQPLHSLPWKNFFATVRKNHLKTRGNVRVPPMPQYDLFTTGSCRQIPQTQLRTEPGTSLNPSHMGRAGAFQQTALFNITFSSQVFCSKNHLFNRAAVGIEMET